MTKTRTCATPSCMRDIHARDLCRYHYDRQDRRKRGEPDIKAPPRGLGRLKCKTCGGLIADHNIADPTCNPSHVLLP